VSSPRPARLLGLDADAGAGIEAQHRAPDELGQVRADALPTVTVDRIDRSELDRPDPRQTPHRSHRRYELIPLPRIERRENRHSRLVAAPIEEAREARVETET